MSRIPAAVLGLLPAGPALAHHAEEAASLLPLDQMLGAAVLALVALAVIRAVRRRLGRRR